MLRWIGLATMALCLSWSSFARAGVCVNDVEIEEVVERLERYASHGGEPPPSYWDLCVKPGETFRQRVAKACTKIIKRDQGAKVGHTPSSGSCRIWLVEDGTTTVGDEDLVAALLGGNWDLIYPPTDKLRALAASGDPRVRGFLSGKLREHLATVKAKPLRGWKANAWVQWQLAGLAALRKLGDASDVALLDELVAATKDKKVHKAAAKAKAEIAARAAAAP